VLKKVEQIITIKDSPVKNGNGIKTEEKKNVENISKNYENISDSFNTTRKRPRTDSSLFVIKKNEALYQHSTDNWTIRINEDNMTLVEKQEIPDEAKEFLELPLQDLIELGILIKKEQTTEGNSEADEKKVKIELPQNGTNGNESHVKNEVSLDLTIDDGDDIIIL